MVSRKALAARWLFEPAVDVTTPIVSVHRIAVAVPLLLFPQKHPLETRWIPLRWTKRDLPLSDGYAFEQPRSNMDLDPLEKRSYSDLHFHRLRVMWIWP